jgi:hypothetical protein
MMQEETSFCEQKEAKKLLILGHGRWTGHSPCAIATEFFWFAAGGRFFSKKNCF